MKKLILTPLLILLTACLGQVTGIDSVDEDSATIYSEYVYSHDDPSNPGTGWYQYWPHGAAGTEDIEESTHASRNTSTSGVATFTQTLTGLEPDTLYHVQRCGYGGDPEEDGIAPPGECTGPKVGGSYYASNGAGEFPAAYDESVFASFRTANDSEGLVATVDLGRLHSASESKVDWVSRDAGYFAELPWDAGQGLWLFADSASYIGGSLDDFTARGTAAVGPFEAGAAPQGLVEQGTLLTPYFPAVTGLEDAQGGACTDVGEYPGAWVSGVTDAGNDEILVSFLHYCVEFPGPIFTPERFLLANHSESGGLGTPVVVEEDLSGLPAAWELGSPVVVGDDLYLFARSLNEGVLAARVDLDSRDYDDQYRWWDGDSWDGFAAQAEPVHDDDSAKLVHVADYSALGRDLVMLLQVTVGGVAEVAVLESEDPEGPWTESARFKLPSGCDGGSQFGCYAVVPHPLLSTSSRLVFTYFTDSDRQGGSHLRVGGMDWPE